MWKAIKILIEEEQEKENVIFALFLFSHEPLIALFVGCRWLKIRAWVINLFRVLLKRFHWGFLLAGFTALAMAAISWKLETSRTYWIWHR